MSVSILAFLEQPPVHYTRCWFAEDTITLRASGTDLKYQ